MSIPVVKFTRFIEFNEVVYVKPLDTWGFMDRVKTTPYGLRVYRVRFLYRSPQWFCRIQLQVREECKDEGTLRWFNNFDTRR